MSTTPRIYQYPIQTSRLMTALTPSATEQEHPTFPLGASIAQLLHLLVHTRPGELRSAPSFGCAVWDIEFDNDVNLARWEETLTRSLRAAIQEHEPRLSEAKVEITITAITAGSAPKQMAAQQQARVTVTGVLALTGEAFRYSTLLYLGQFAT